MLITIHLVTIMLIIIHLVQFFRTICHQSQCYHLCVKSAHIRSFSASYYSTPYLSEWEKILRISLYSVRMGEDTPYLSVFSPNGRRYSVCLQFSPNARKYGQEKLQIRTLFTQLEILLKKVKPGKTNYGLIKDKLRSVNVFVSVFHVPLYEKISG